MAKTVVKISVVQVYNTYSPCDSHAAMHGQMYINMLQEEGYWSCPPDHHMRSDHHIDRFKFMDITILY